MEQLVACQSHNLKVVGSSPITATIRDKVLIFIHELAMLLAKSSTCFSLEGNRFLIFLPVCEDGEFFQRP